MSKQPEQLLEGSKARSKQILAVDPGRRKCGLAVVNAEGIAFREVVPCEEFPELVKSLYEKYQPTDVLLGDSTGSKEILAVISEQLGFEATVVDERHTTEQAKFRYFKEFPPRGLWKLVPLGLQTPPTCYDDFAAVVLAERYLKEEENA